MKRFSHYPLFVFTLIYFFLLSLDCWWNLVNGIGLWISTSDRANSGTVSSIKVWKAQNICDPAIVNATQECLVCFQTGDKDLFMLSFFLEEWKPELLVEWLNLHNYYNSKNLSQVACVWLVIKVKVMWGMEMIQYRSLHIWSIHDYWYCRSDFGTVKVNGLCYLGCIKSQIIILECIFEDHRKVWPYKLLPHESCLFVFEALQPFFKYCIPSV